MEVSKKPITWTHIAGIYAGILVAAGFIFLVIVSASRDPNIGSLLIPTAQWFRVVASLLALSSGLTALVLMGLTMDRGTPQQMLTVVPSIALILVLLDLISMRM